MSLAKSKKSPDCFPRSPFRVSLRASERSWQGNPPVQTVAVGILSPGVFSLAVSLMSLAQGMLGQCCWRMSRQNSEISHCQTIFIFFVRSRPRSNPPMPAKKEAAVHFSDLPIILPCGRAASTPSILSISEQYTRPVADGRPLSPALGIIRLKSGSIRIHLALRERNSTGITGSASPG